MIHVACNFCGRDDTQPVNQGPDLYLGRPGHFCLVRCRHCGLIYQDPRPSPDELPELYPAAEYELYSPAIAGEPSAVRRADRAHGMSRRRRQIERFRAEPGRLLDIGCATGNFMAAMRDHGWQVTGVELSREAAAYAREKLGLDVHTGMLEEQTLPDGAFDVVTMWDVLEHVLDPRVTLAGVRRLLRPGGLFVASVPNPASLEARLFGDSWAGWDRPRHLHLFPPDLLCRYLLAAGFADITLRSFSGRLRVTLLSVEYLLRARQIPESKWRPWLGLAYNLPLRLITWPLYRLGEHFNQTTNITAFAR
jgi:SAM-dependent methyltransferase